MGALVLKTQSGLRLELSGFTDQERAVHWIGAGDAVLTRSPENSWIPTEGLLQEGREASANWSPTAFPKGTVVTYTYRELTDSGVPKEARYLRVRSPE